eukprot:365391-Pyramimonas_sp.AAC.1
MEMCNPVCNPADVKPTKFRDRLNDWKEFLILATIFVVLVLAYIFVSGGISEPPAVRYVNREPKIVVAASQGAQHARSLLELDEPSEETDTHEEAAAEDTSEGAEGNAAAAEDTLEIDPTITPARVRR